MQNEKYLYQDTAYYQILEPEEVKALPNNTLVYIVSMKNGVFLQQPQKHMIGERFGRKVLYQMPFKNKFRNIGLFKNRIYLLPI